MRSWVLALALGLFVFAYVLPTESLDKIYWARPDMVAGVGLDGRVLWSQSVVFPLIATDAAGRCVAVADRPYVYKVEFIQGRVERSFLTTVRLSPEIVEALRQSGVQVPDEINVVLNLSIPLPPVVLAYVYKTTVVSLFTPYGYPLWAVNLGPRANVTAVATSCEYVVAGTVFGEVYVIRDGRVVDQFFLEGLPAPTPGARGAPLDPPITALVVGRSGTVAYVGTAWGDIYRFRLPTEQELRSGKFDRQLAKVGSCGGAVYGLYTTPSDDVIALCFVKKERPYVVVYPWNLALPDPVLVTYGIDAPRLVSAVSQDGRWVFVGVGNEVVGIVDGRVARRFELPAKPSAVAASWNGSMVAVGTSAGHFYLFKDGVPVVRTDPVSTYLLLRSVGGNVTGNFTLQQAFAGVRPVTSVAVSFDGQVAAYETWDEVKVLYTARVPYVVDAPDVCMPLETAVYLKGTNVAYLYKLGRSGVLYIPYGEVDVMPLYRYMEDRRCRPQRNFTLTIFGDVAEPLVFRYVLEYRVYKQPPGLVAGPDWASGPASYTAKEPAGVQVSISYPSVAELQDVLGRLASAVSRMARVEFAGWSVDGRFVATGLPVFSVSVDKPTTVAAVYRVVMPELYTEGSYGLRLVTAFVYDSAGNLVDAGASPKFSTYPVYVEARYVPVVAVDAGKYALVNGTAGKFWAPYGSTVEIRAPEVVELGNKTRLVFVMWAETKDASPSLRITVTTPVRLTPVYKRQYLVAVTPPARIAGVSENATWVDEGEKITVTAPAKAEGATRYVVKNWVVNGVPNATLNQPTATLVVKMPMNITFETMRQFLIQLSSRFGSVPPNVWVDEGGTVAVVPTPTEAWSPPPLHYVFTGWRDVATGVVYTYPAMP
ncbi:MAG: hypothetical protein ABWK05_04240, partial [Pyrobaculum sp.]